MSDKKTTILYIIRYKDKFGFIDRNGKIIIKPIFNNDQFFNRYEGAVVFDNLIPIKQKKKWGYIDSLGNFIISPQFDVALPFSEGLAPVGLKVGMSYGIPDCKWGYIDLSGQLVIDYQFNWIEKFENGQAIASIPDNRGLVGRYHGKHGVINKKGAFVIKPIYESIGDFSEGLYNVEIKKKWGYIDAKGKIIIPLHYSDASPFKEGLAKVQEDNKNYLCIGKTGKTIHSCSYDSKNFEYGFETKYSIYRFCEGLAIYISKDKCGYINNKGEETIKAQFNDATDFHEGFACVKIDKKWGFINHKGEIVIQPQFKSSSLFNEGLAMAHTDIKIDKKDYSRYGFIDPKGEFIIKPQFTKPDERPITFDHNLASVILDKKRTYINKSGKVVWQET